MRRTSSKLGYLVPEFPGQTHSFFWREIVELRKLGVDVHILSTRRPPKAVQHDWVSEVAVEYVIPMSPFGFARSLVLLTRGLPALLRDQKTFRLLLKPRNLALAIAAARLLDLLRRSRINHLHVHSCADAALLAVLSRKMGGPPYSLTLHGALSGYGGYQELKWENASAVFSVSRALKQEVSKVLPRQGPRVRIAPMGVDTEVFRRTQQERVPLSGFRWFVCARLNQGKGFITLLDAISKVKADRAFSVRIAGEDDQGGKGYRRELEEEILTRRLQDRVVLLGALPQEMVLRELQEADGFVLPSNDEALGVAYMEAMACELPVIGSRVGGVPELIEDDVSGILISPGNSEELASAMLRIMDSSGLRHRLGRAARGRIVDNFSPRRSASELASLVAGRGMSL